ncbi:SDR family NAD(P)-dependent oxidoreductase [Paenibacillus sp. PL91]|uniref:SDR family NAD(P)-dependent oxidoreductase n=1 Tax=Paenibacillus sp. PL91 TaxID=2729538 RepID=UPI00145F6960|nr:SDR family NAD(P)-dependent oxidoreductase [Paenibacillus sp. PL91]MBC9199222.1 SDR family NAD(P)-dependent oxidoreductase [Paenibacillus sp. PL91]
MQLEGKVATITGGGSGIGEATARLFANHGAKVIIADWNETEASRVANEINRLLTANGGAYAVKTEVSSEQLWVQRKMRLC